MFHKNTIMRKKSERSDKNPDPMRLSDRSMRAILTMLAVLMLAPSIRAQQQGPIFSQPFASPLRTNPALMGANDDVHFGLGYRGKWMSFEDGYTTPRFTFMMPVLFEEGSKLDLGLSVINDQAGAFNHMNAMLAVGYDLNLSEHHHFSAALTGGYSQVGLARDELTFDEQYVDGSFNEANPHNETSLGDQAGYADLGFGLLWYHNQGAPQDSGVVNAFAGLSGYHMNAPNATLVEGAGKVPRRFSSIIGVEYLPGGPFSFTPNLRVENQGGRSRIASGLYAGYWLEEGKEVQLGVWYKEDGSYAFGLGTEISGFRFSYTYDIPTSRIRTRFSGLQTHEISLSYALDYGEDRGPSPFPIF